ncbi:MAG: sulfatase-like hydrolase/transferase [Rikenellaceae bacterium]
MKNSTIIALSTLISLSNGEANANGRNSEDRPNVIFIYADDMGKGMLSAYGQHYIETPNIDMLIKGGVQFSNAYGCHYSAPARASLLTGYSDLHKDHWQKTSGGGFIVADTAKIATIESELNMNDVALGEGDDYLPEIFAKAGYATGQIGKLEYGFMTSRQQMFNHGWDYFYGFLDHNRCHAFYPIFLFENEKIVMIEGNTLTDCGLTREDDSVESYLDRIDMSGKAQYSQDLFNVKIAEFIEAHKDEPFFLYHPTQLPHGPVAVPKIDKRVENIPSLNTLEKEYATMMLLLDDAVGMIMSQIERLGLSDNTIIVFSSDNGHEIYYEAQGRTSKTGNPVTGEKIDNHNVIYRSEVVGDIFNGNMSMAGNKRSNLNGGINVPLIYYCPSKFKAHQCSELVSNYDFIITMAQMLNVNTSESKQGISYYDLLLDSTATLPNDRFVLADSFEGPTIIRNDGWKLRYCNVTTEYELYNILTDKEEYKNLASQYPEIANKLRQELIQYIDTTVCRTEYIDLK